MRRLREFLAVLFIIAVVVGINVWPESHAAGETRNFHPYTIAQITAENPANWKHPLTHIEVSGWLTYKVHEGDGDWHLRLCDSAKLASMDAKRCVVAEVIPELPIAPIPKVGQYVTVQGIGRYDAENPGHHWWECHPVTKMSAKDKQ